MVRPGQEFLISNRLIRMLAFESARFGPDTSILSLIEESGYVVTDRYAPMARLLAQDDVLLLVQHGLQAQSKQLRRERRSCYFEYVTLLTQEVRVARRLRTLAMASTERWSFRTLLVATVVSESSLLYLRWLGYRHAAGISVAANDVKECLNFLLAVPRSPLAVT